MTVKKDLDELNDACKKIVDLTESPLLVMYYPDHGGIILEDDVESLYNHLRNSKLSTTTQLKSLTVVLHTHGGNPNAAYHLAQVIRDFTHVLYIVVPYSAASAGTIFCLSADTIYLGATATLGAIDVTYRDVELASISQYLNFALDARESMESRFRDHNIENKKSSVESDLLVELVKHVDPLNIGMFYRKRNISSVYAGKLLRDYLLSEEKNKIDMATDLAHILTNEMPAHDFILDFAMCKEIGLPVNKLKENISDNVRRIIQLLTNLTDAGVICKDLPKIDNQDYKDNFFQFYPYIDKIEHNESDESQIEYTRSSRENAPRETEENPEN